MSKEAEASAEAAEAVAKASAEAAEAIAEAEVAEVLPAELILTATSSSEATSCSDDRWRFLRAAARLAGTFFLGGMA